MRVNMGRIVTTILLLACCADDHPPVSPEIVLVPIGTVPAEVMAQLQRELPAIMKRDITIAEAIPLPERAFDPSRSQYLGHTLLEELVRRDDGRGDRVVGIIDADAYAPGLNFIFGQANLPGRFAVVALPRLRKDPARFHDRLLKETVHELGHTFGFKHCPNRRCVMAFSNSLGDTDYKEAMFCKRERLR